MNYTFADTFTEVESYTITGTGEDKIKTYSGSPISLDQTSPGRSIQFSGFEYEGVETNQPYFKLNDNDVMLNTTLYDRNVATSPVGEDVLDSDDLSIMNNNTNLLSVDDSSTFVLSREHEMQYDSQLFTGDDFTSLFANSLIVCTSQQEDVAIIESNKNNTNGTAETPYQHNVNDKQKEPGDASNDKAERTNYLGISQEKNKIEGSFVCDLCNKKYKSKKNLSAHMRIHTKKGVHQCEVCRKTFDQPRYLTAHMILHDPNKRHACRICSKTFKDIRNALRHEKIHNTKKHLSHLDKHNKKVYQGKECEKSFKNNSVLASHEISHNSTKNLYCDVCNRVFKGKQGLFKHMRTHGPEYPYQCETCKQGFKKKKTYQNHALGHSKENAFMCELCGKCFVNNSKFKKHYISHSNDKPYKCDICVINFKYRGNHKKHMKSKHTMPLP